MILFFIVLLTFSCTASEFTQFLDRAIAYQERKTINIPGIFSVKPFGLPVARRPTISHQVSYQQIKAAQYIFFNPAPIYDLRALVTQLQKIITPLGVLTPEHRASKNPLLICYPRYGLSENGSTTIIQDFGKGKMKEAGETELTNILLSQNDQILSPVDLRTSREESSEYDNLKKIISGQEQQIDALTSKVITLEQIIDRLKKREKQILEKISTKLIATNKLLENNKQKKQSQDERQKSDNILTDMRNQRQAKLDKQLNNLRISAGNDPYKLLQEVDELIRRCRPETNWMDL